MKSFTRLLALFPRGVEEGMAGRANGKLYWFGRQGSMDQELNMLMGLNGAKLVCCLTGSIASSHSGEEY